MNVSIFFQSSASARQVRLRLAACQRSVCGEVLSELPAEEWNMSPSRHVSSCASHLFLFSCVIVSIFVSS